MQVYQVDFVIISLGQFSDVPNMPEFPPNKGPEAFHGKVIHSMEYVAMDYKSLLEFVKGKRVTVVGFQKNALDIAMECSAANGLEFPCTFMYKTEHLECPRLPSPGSPFGILLPEQVLELLVHKPWRRNSLSLLATLFSPLFYDQVDEGSIILKKSPSFSFCEEGILVNGETEPLKTVLVILATGFGMKKSSKTFLSPKPFKTTF
ncbi:hypothetical protein Patl1_35707 [Pistacia atlantica]|nr:hypothetical protein Patl1_35707 [Pistacia atlantica]